jgi:hypothetical protein
LSQKLTAQLAGAHDAALPTNSNSLWYQILTNGETAPLPRLDLPEALDFQDVKSRDSPQQTPWLFSRSSTTSTTKPEPERPIALAAPVQTEAGTRRA